MPADYSLFSINVSKESSDMSKAKNDHIWSKKYLDRAISRLVSKTLREAHRNSSAALKHIARTTQLNALTIRKWYEGKNPPDAAHLLILMAHYPDLLCGILQLIDRTKSVGSNSQITTPKKTENCHTETHAEHKIWGDIPVTPSATKNSVMLNQRQLWFIEQVRARHRCTSKDIERRWSVTNRTAKRDIAALVAVGAIRFVRSGQSGYYTGDADS